MAGLAITITDAGRAALVNAQGTGTPAVTISHIGVSPQHTAGSLKALTALPGELKRLTTFGGDVVAPDVFHVTIRDETAQVYTLRAFGLYLSTGVLFAVCSSAAVILEKSAGAMTLLAADVALKTLDTAQITFGGTGFINPPATTERMGVVELATSQEAAAGARADVAVTPLGLLVTLQSWAGNFAAKAHRHVMGEVDGLLDALAAKSPTGHKHDAGDTTTGVFNVGRIPALAMEKITGLAAALAGKQADLGYTPVQQGTGANQNGNVVKIGWDGEALRATVDVVDQGPFVFLSTLLDYLANQKHAAADIVSGVFDVGRIPALAMEKITGLATALAGKASLAGATFLGSVYFGDAAGRGAVRIQPGTTTRPGTVEFMTPDGVRRGYIGYANSDAGGYLMFQGESGWGWRVSSRPLFGDATPWDSANFDPASRAAALHQHAMDDVVGLSAALAGKQAALGFAPVQQGTGTGQLGNLVKLGWDGTRLRATIDTTDQGQIVFQGHLNSAAAVCAPPSAIGLFARSSAPSGWLACNGAAVSRTSYAALFAAIGTTFGAGDGSTTFNLPDLRGEFLRGWDAGRGTDSGRALGSWQGQDIQSHTHQTVVGQAAGGSNNGLYSSGDDYTGTLRSYVDTLATGGAETRPRNVALLACIKF